MPWKPPRHSQASNWVCASSFAYRRHVPKLLGREEDGSECSALEPLDFRHRVAVDRRRISILHAPRKNHRTCVDNCAWSCRCPSIVLCQPESRSSRLIDSMGRRPKPRARGAEGCGAHFSSSESCPRSEVLVGTYPSTWCSVPVEGSRRPHGHHHHWIAWWSGSLRAQLAMGERRSSVSMTAASCGSGKYLRTRLVPVMRSRHGDQPRDCVPEWRLVRRLIWTCFLI